jgi:cell division protein FtsA
MQASSEIDSTNRKTQGVSDFWSKIHAWFKGEF